MHLVDKENEVALRTLVRMLGQEDANHMSHKKLLELYQKALKAVPGLEVAVDRFWAGLPQHDNKSSYVYPYEAPFPNWLIGTLIRKPELLPMMKLFPYLVGGSCGDAFTLKSDFLHLPLLSYEQYSLEKVYTSWNCTEEFLIKHLEEKDWVGMAANFFLHFEDYRGEAFSRGLACLMVFQEEGGVLDPETVYKIFETGFTHMKKHLYWPLMARTVGYIINFMRRSDWKTVAEMKEMKEWHLKGELDGRIREVGKKFPALMGWLHDIIVDKKFKTRGEEREEKQAREDEEDEKRRIEAEESASKRQKVEVEVGQ
jgi:hypothetical protein